MLWGAKISYWWNLNSEDINYDHILNKEIVVIAIIENFSCRLHDTNLRQVQRGKGLWHKPAVIGQKS